MCLRQLPMYQKCPEFFLDPKLKRFSGNKPHKLTQNGPKRCIFRNFQTHYLGSTMCLWQLPMYQKSTEFFLDPQLKRFSGNKQHKLTQNVAFFGKPLKQRILFDSNFFTFSLTTLNTRLHCNAIKRFQCTDFKKTNRCFFFFFSKIREIRY